jgi:membrane-associated protease RseP (regulator of RpoE activity)
VTARRGPGRRAYRPRTVGIVFPTNIAPHRRTRHNGGSFVLRAPMILTLLSVIVILVFVHVTAMAACARLLGIGVTRIGYGIGPAILDLGLVRIAPLPLGGYVRLAMSTDGPKRPPADRTFDTQPRWKRVLLLLTGPAVLLALGYVLLGLDAGPAFAHGFRQLVGGALAPFGTAQTQLHAARIWVAGHALPAIVGIGACKMAAFQLLPFIGSNGMQAVAAVLPAGLVRARAYARLRPALIVLGFVLPLGWLLALLVAVFA